jgi:general stress protein CsbA
MNLRQKIQIVILLILILFTFASYHEGSGSTVWLQWLTVVSIAAYVFLFDVAFTNDSQFLFDPDAENWRRKTVRSVV